LNQADCGQAHLTFVELLKLTGGGGNLIIEVGWTRIDGLQIMCMLSFQGFVFVRTRKYVFFNLLLFLYMITYFLSIPHIKIFFLLLCTIMTKSLWLLKSDLYLTLDSKLEFYLHFLHFINNKKATYWSIDSWDWKTLLKTCPPGRKVCSWSDLVSAWGSGWWTTWRTWTGGWSGRCWGSRVSQNHILQRNNANISEKIWRDSLRLYLASWLLR